MDDMRLFDIEFFPDIDEENDALDIWTSSEEDDDPALEIIHYGDSQWGLRLRGFEVECDDLHFLETGFIRSISPRGRNLLAAIVNAWDEEYAKLKEEDEPCW